MEETDLKLVSESLARKASKKRPGPVPPRRTTSVKEQQQLQQLQQQQGEHLELDLELKTRMKLQKAKVENSTVLEEDERGGGGGTKVDGSPKVSREDSMGKSSSAADNLKAAQIDRSKYLISEANARSFEHGVPERTSGRRLGPPPHGGMGKLVDGMDLSSGTAPGVGQYPKKAIPLPQRPGMGPYKKMSEPCRPSELMHSLSMEDDSEQVGRGFLLFLFIFICIFVCASFNPLCVRHDITHAALSVPMASVASVLSVRPRTCGCLPG